MIIEKLGIDAARMLTIHQGQNTSQVGHFVLLMLATLILDCFERESVGGGEREMGEERDR